jgi:oligopeptidase A
VATLIAAAERTVDEIERRGPSAGYDEVIAPLDDAMQRLEQALALVVHLDAVATTPALRRAREAASVDAARFQGALARRPGLHRHVARVAATSSPDTARGRRARLLAAQGDREGAALGSTLRHRLTEIDAELATLCGAYGRHVEEATTALGTDESDYIAAMTHTPSRREREILYRAYNRRAAEPPWQNAALAVDILRLRREKARTIGVPTFAHLVAGDRMLATPDAARAMLGTLRDRCRASFAAETAAMWAAADGPVAAWDVAYLAEQGRRAAMRTRDEALAPYFRLDDVLPRVLAVVAQRFGLTIVADDDAPRWHDEVLAYTIGSPTGGGGTVYVDLMPRAGKHGGAWMHGLVTGTGEGRAHVAALVANLGDGAGTDLLGHREVRLVLHELGHLLHHVLSEAPLAALSGTRVPWDFVEFPAYMLEELAWDDAALQAIGRHTDTGDPIPLAHCEALRRGRSFRAASGFMRQLGFAELDLALHLHADLDGADDLQAWARRQLAPYGAAPVPDDVAVLANFTHAFAHPAGYAAGYYAYPFAEVLAADAVRRFGAARPLDLDVARAFVSEVLAPGNTRDPLASFEAFVGRPPSIDALIHRLSGSGSALPTPGAGVP